MICHIENLTGQLINYSYDRPLAASTTVIEAPISRPFAYGPFDGLGDALGVLMLPKCQANPAVFREFGVGSSVAFTVGFQFPPPPIGICLRKRRVFRA